MTQIDGSGFWRRLLIAIGVSIVSGAFVGSTILQAYFAIFSPSSFGRFAEFPIILIYSSLIIIFIHLVLILPLSAFLRNKIERIGFLPAALFGGTIGFIFMLLANFGGSVFYTQLAYIVSGTASGATCCFAFLMVLRSNWGKGSDPGAQPGAVGNEGHHGAD
jgi:uncharacterized membrane protein